MTLYLRNKKNETIVDIEINVKKTPLNGHGFVELRSVVVIETYSKFLLENMDIADDVISIFSEISELRGWLWETYFMGGDNDPNEYKNVVNEVSSLLKDVAIKYDLNFITD